MDIDRVAFLHIDCDFYEPTKLVLEHFVPKMVPGGYVQLEDYTSFEGCRRAVNEFLATRKDVVLAVEKGVAGLFISKRNSNSTGSTMSAEFGRPDTAMRPVDRGTATP